MPLLPGSKLYILTIVVHYCFKRRTIRVLMLILPFQRFAIPTYLQKRPRALLAKCIPECRLGDVKYCPNLVALELGQSATFLEGGRAGKDSLLWWWELSLQKLWYSPKTWFLVHQCQPHIPHRTVLSQRPHRTWERDLDSTMWNPSQSVPRRRSRSSFVLGGKKSWPT